MQMMTPTEHEKAEWSRMAQDAYAAGCNAVGHRYSTTAACTLIGGQIPLATFDALQAAYRSWLCFNDFKAADYMVQRHLYPKAAA